MKKLQDLKQDILDEKIQDFYVFYGEDYGIRKHYIDKIGTFFKQTINMDDCESVMSLTATKSLFSIKRLIVVYNDTNFAKSSHRVIETFIRRLQDYCVILVYEQELPNTTLFKEFSHYITYFPVVQDNIAIEFVESELNLLPNNKEVMIKDCSNNYNNILLESNKIKNYAQAKGMTQQNSYEILETSGQLLMEYDEFNSSLFMNDILTGAFENLTYWIGVIKSKYTDKFYFSLTSMFFDYLIAYLIQRYGKWDGSSRAYNYGLSWGRAKTIREFNIPYTADNLLDTAYRVSEIDIKVKSGELLREDVIDYFITLVI